MQENIVPPGCTEIGLDILDIKTHPSFSPVTQSLVQNSRKAGITSALTSSTLHNEELVSPGFHRLIKLFYTMSEDIPAYCKQNLTLLLCLCPCRRAMFIRRPYRPSYIQSPAPPRTTLRCGQPPRPLTVTSVRGCCGVLLARACAVLSVESNATRSAKICSMQTVCKVREISKTIILHTTSPSVLQDTVYNICRHQSLMKPCTMCCKHYSRCLVKFF